MVSGEPVLYNRFFEPDIDIDSMEYVPASGLSTPAELHKSLRDVAIATAEIPGMDISVSTGVHSGADTVKAILAGARTVQALQYPAYKRYAGYR